MSRSYKRKKVRNDHILEHYCYEYKLGHRCPIYSECSINCSYRDDKATLRLYRKETHVGYGYSVPKAVCKTYNRERKAKDKAEVNRLWRQEDYEEYNFEPWVQDAGWRYW